MWRHFILLHSGASNRFGDVCFSVSCCFANTIYHPKINTKQTKRSRRVTTTGTVSDTIFYTTSNTYTIAAPLIFLFLMAYPQRNYFSDGVMCINCHKSTTNHYYTYHLMRKETYTYWKKLIQLMKWIGVLQWQYHHHHRTKWILKIIWHNWSAIIWQFIPYTYLREYHFILNW